MIAPAGHTAGLIGIILLFAFSGRMLIAPDPAGAVMTAGRSGIFMVALASMWVLAWYVMLGLRRSGTALKEILFRSQRRQTAGQIATAVATAALMFFAWGIVGGVLWRFLQPNPADVRSLVVLLAESPGEKALWVAMSLSAGFCEELVYRGYLQRQFEAWTGWILTAVVLQAVLYAIAHAALPPDIMILVFVLGLFFGVFAAWTRTLLPGMLMHTAIDLLAVFAKR